jgi:hypothetical protein
MRYLCSDVWLLANLLQQLNAKPLDSCLRRREDSLSKLHNTFRAPTRTTRTTFVTLKDHCNY